MVQNIIRIRYGDTTIPESWVFTGGDPEKAVPIFFSCFLVLTDRKKILVDAGCETMPGFVMENFRKPVEVLDELGYKQEDITDVVNRWVKEKRISGYGNSRKGVLWGILNKAGLYTRSKTNWNGRVS